ncbi:protein of unknown function (DU1801) [Ekhidna lutea]|uniref:YdhG-like domain-containing protein n=1 Tax=Ekhidna lutea TaxID=447679 RepID=A0A239KNJ9_EKHLU|nr:DUF1801 domain-containing protein [Ekhidna lutea]SNT19248.1 protein of unknown function (DU1801) [Ekhidna lutea]
MSTIQHFILGLDGQQKAIVSYLHHMMLEYDLIGKIRFKIPMYFQKSWVCYLNPIKNDGIELAFLNGYQLSNEQGILQAKNRKMVAGIDIFHVNEIPETAVREIINEALILDQIAKTKN